MLTMEHGVSTEQLDLLYGAQFNHIVELFDFKNDVLHSLRDFIHHNAFLVFSKPRSYKR